MKKFYICGVERLGYWIDERYLGCYSSWGSCGIVELPGGLGDCTSFVSGVACSSGPVELSSGARRYELRDWLGSVRVGVTDQRLPMQAQERPLTGLVQGIVYRKAQKDEFERGRDGNLAELRINYERENIPFWS
jgi:hypothetical protein